MICKKNIFLIILSHIILVFCFFCGCDDNEGSENESIIVIMPKVTDVGSNSAKLVAGISPKDVSFSEKGFLYSEKNQIPTFFNDIQVQCKDSFEVEISSLKEDYTYFIRAYAITVVGDTIYSPVLEFTTLEQFYVVTLEDYTCGNGFVTVFGKVDGNTRIESKGFVYSETDSIPTLENGEVVFVSSFLFSSDINLKSGILYYVRAFAISPTDTIYGNVIQIICELKEPSLETLAVNNKTRSAAIACGQFIEKGDIDIKEYGICLARNQNPTINDTKIVFDRNIGHVDEKGRFGVFFDYLTPSTHYFIRAYAIAMNGEVYYGDNESFETNSIPAVEPLTWRWCSNMQGAIDAGHYDGITQAMDSAMYYYRNYSNLGDWIGVEYNPGVPTADCNNEGWLRFGSNTRYHFVGTAQHEIAHALGVGTSRNWKTLIQYNGDRTWAGEVANLTLKVMMKDMTQIIKGDGQHFWPGGINQREEVTSGTKNSYGVVIKDADMLKLNAMVLNAMRIDGLAEN
jgi:hypothetical protein